MGTEGPGLLLLPSVPPVPTPPSMERASPAWGGGCG